MQAPRDCPSTAGVWGRASTGVATVRRAGAGHGATLRGMGRRHLDPPADLPRVFRGRDLVDAGVLRPAHLRGPWVRRLFRGVYAPAWVEVTHHLRCEGAGLLLPDGAALTGRSGMAALGVDLTRSYDAVEVVVHENHRFGPIRGMSVRLCTYPVRGQTWRTTCVAFPERLALDVAARRSLPDAVAGLDAGLAAGLFDPARVGDWLERCHDHDVVAARRALELADDRAESPPESIVRVVLALAGIHTEPQFVVRRAGRRIARVDLAVVERRLVIEYNGLWHRKGSQPAKDRERYRALRDAGWSVVVIDADLLGDHAAVVAVVRAALAERPVFAA